jgi:hypothetical protein
LLLTNGPINFDPDYCLLNPKIKMIKVALKSLKEDREAYDQSFGQENQNKL